MLISEKVAYLKGLFEGLSIDDKKKEGKLLKGILDVLADISIAIEDLECDIEEINDGLADTYEDIEDIYNELDDNLGYDGLTEDHDDELDVELVYDDLQGDNASEIDCSCGCCSVPEHGDEDLGSKELYEVICPTCGEEIFFDEETLEEGSTKCHACGEDLEFDISDLEKDISELENV